MGVNGFSSSLLDANGFQECNVVFKVRPMVEVRAEALRKLKEVLEMHSEGL